MPFPLNIPGMKKFNFLESTTSLQEDNQGLYEKVFLEMQVFLNPIDTNVQTSDEDGQRKPDVGSK
jgi:hypothetical protein